MSSYKLKYLEILQLQQIVYTICGGNYQYFDYSGGFINYIPINDTSYLFLDRLGDFAQGGFSTCAKCFIGEGGF